MVMFHICTDKYKPLFIMKYILFCLTLVFLAGCGTTHQFSKRKYLKGRFSDKAEKYATIDSDIDNLTASTTPIKIDIRKNNALKTTSLRPELNLPVRSFYKVYDDSLVKPVISKTNLQSKSKTALFLGGLSLASFATVLITPFLITLSVLFGILALIYASKVIRNPEANSKQKINARVGKVLGIISLSFYAICMVLLVIVITVVAAASSIPLFPRDK